MTEASIVEIGLAALTGLFVVLWYLLTQKDAKQEDAIKLLWTKHDDDAKGLELLKLQIASQHYVKAELDTKFDRMDATMRTGFSDLGGKVEGLSRTLLTHFQKADK